MAVSTEITFAHRAEAWIVGLAMDHFAKMPFDRASDAGAAWMRTIGPLLPHNTRARNNIALAFPNESEAWRAELLDASWAQLGRWAGEFQHLPEISFAEGNGRVELVGGEILDAVRESGKGAIFISGHFASFEIMPVAIVQRGVKCFMTYRPLNNPILDARVLAIRQAYGAKLQAAKSLTGGMGLMRALTRGESVAIMNDQKYNEGVAAPLFGHDAMTADGPARLALKYNVPLIPMSVRRLNNRAQFRVEAHPAIPIDKSLGETAAVKDAVVRVNQFIEAQIRAAPEQWWWVHNRWPKEAWRAAGIV
jgi:KDO2-lipid IV(A) lauroyltransferase